MAGFPMVRAFRQPNFTVLLAAAWLIAALRLLVQDWPDTGRTFPDADDAMRLTALRAYMAGHGWFDVHETRLAPPLGYDSHWSRLIDMGLAGLFSVFHLFAGSELAERLMRAIWPLLWLLPTIGGVAAITWRLAGEKAALIVLVFALVATPAYQQFAPGRIDHHNVQIALAVLTLAATVWSDRRPWTAWAAGGLTGLALAVGLEGLLYLAACGAAFGTGYLIDARGTRALRAYGMALAGSAAAAFLVSVAPARWTDSACDAIAVNWAAPIVLGGVLLAAIGAWPSQHLGRRAAAVAAACAVVLLAFVVIEPRCLAGPYAMMDQSTWSAWMDDVREMQPLVRMIHTMPIVAAAVAAFPAVALLSVLWLSRDPGMRRDPAFWLATATFGLAALTTLGALKAFSYAIWFGMPLVAVAALHIAALLQLSSLAAHAVLALLLTPAALSSGAITIAFATGLHDREDFSQPENKGCFEFDSYRGLAALPPGLVATETRYGPYVLALTPHAVVAAPYHRLSSTILQNHRAFAAPPDEAAVILRNMNVTYVAICGGRPPPGLNPRERSASLWGQLQDGRVPDWLEAVAISPEQAFRVFRLNR
jgi:hypothetical protein